MSADNKALAEQVYNRQNESSENRVFENKLIRHTNHENLNQARCLGFSCERAANSARAEKSEGQKTLFIGALAGALARRHRARRGMACALASGAI